MAFSLCELTDAIWHILRREVVHPRRRPLPPLPDAVLDRGVPLANVSQVLGPRQVEGVVGWAGVDDRGVPEEAVAGDGLVPVPEERGEQEAWFALEGRS